MASIPPHPAPSDGSSLMRSRRFVPLFWCQFFSAFNDNYLKTALVFLILFRIGDSHGEALITLAGAIFIAPYFFLSALGGELADRYDKALVARRLKLAEIAVAAVAVIGFALSSLAVLFAALFGFGVIAALFGPIKYGILPDHLPTASLPSANALVEGATFIAILTGTMAAGFTSAAGGDVVPISMVILVFALACWLSSRMIPPSGEGAPSLVVSRNIAASTAALIRHLRGDSRLWWGALVTSWFWLVGIVTLSLLPPLIKSRLGGDEHAVTAYLALFTVAVGIGSALAAIVARGRIVLNTTLAGAILLGLFAIDLGVSGWGVEGAGVNLGASHVFSSARGLRTAFDLAGIATAGGLYIVPAFAAVQSWAGADMRARTVAAVNILNAAFMTVATVLVAALQSAGVTIPALFIAMGVTTLLAAVAIRRTMPRSPA
jgi:acyl-[acyl-carrier-protein]-phospholipid O-acyltransferase/long-chain-fatty-acid--[acyl-carrier-protein] ligase